MKKIVGTSNQNFNLKAFVFDGLILSYFIYGLTALGLYFFAAEKFQVYLEQAQRDTSFVRQLFVLGFVLFLVTGSVAWAANSKGLKTLGEKIFEPAHLKAAAVKSAWGSPWFYQLLLFLVLSIYLSALITEFSFFELGDGDGFDGAVRLFHGLASPNFDLLPLAIVKIIETIFMAFMATILAIPVAFVMSFVAAKNIMRGPVAFLIYTVVRTFLNVTRSIEALIWAIIFSVWVGIGPFAGMMALMIHSIASLTKQYSEIVESVSDGPIEGILSTGANKLQVVWFAIVPQVILPYISFTVYRWDINIRMATIIGFVGGGGIGTMLIQYQGQAMWPEVGTIIMVIAFVVWFMDTASAYLREALK